jgi:Domain of unknown function (DUF397)
MPATKPRRSGTVWQRASFCGGGECVEVAQQRDVIMLRDSKDPSGPVLRYTRAEWEAFVLGVKAGEFERPR